MTETQLVTAENDNGILTWTDEIFINGEWQTRNYFTENDSDFDRKQKEIVSGEGSYWNLEGDRWK